MNQQHESSNEAPATETRRVRVGKKWMDVPVAPAPASEADLADLAEAAPPGVGFVSNAAGKVAETKARKRRTKLKARRSGKRKVSPHE